MLNLKNNKGHLDINNRRNKADHIDSTQFKNIPSQVLHLQPFEVPHFLKLFPPTKHKQQYPVFMLIAQETTYNHTPKDTEKGKVRENS